MKADNFARMHARADAARYHAAAKRVWGFVILVACLAVCFALGLATADTPSKHARTIKIFNQIEDLRQ